MPPKKNKEKHPHNQKQEPKPVQFKYSVWNAEKKEITHNPKAVQDNKRFITWIFKTPFPRMFAELNFQGDVNDKNQLGVYSVMLSKNIAGSYEYFGYTKNQILTKSCILLYFHPNVSFIYKDRNRKENLFKLLDLTGKPNNKIPKLMSYLFGQYDIFSMKNVKVEYIDDIERNGYNFTDGCGEMSLAIAKEMFRQYHNETWDGMTSYVPSVIQIRFPGIKGVLLLNPELHGRVIRIRPSMRKLNLWTLVEPKTFPLVQKLPASVLGASIPTFAFHRLDAQSLTLLIQRGIKPSSIRKRAKEYIDSVRYASIDIFRGLNLLYITRNSEYSVCLGLIQAYIKGDCREATLLDKIAECLTKYQKKETDGWKKHSQTGIDYKIRLPCESAYLYGACDSKGILKPGQCYAAVTINNQKKVLKGKIVVYRNPCYHPSDILVLEAVDIPCELANVILFPTTGDRPHQDESSGGDLDGDKFTVIWDPELVPTTIQETFDYRSENMIRIVNEYAIAKGLPGANSKKTRSQFKPPQKFESINELTKPVRNVIPRVDALIRKWRKHMADDPKIDDLLNALFNCVVDNEDSLPDIDSVLQTLETEVNLKSDTLSPFNAENDWFVLEMTQCVKHIKQFDSRFLKMQMLRITIVENSLDLIDLDPTAFTFFETTIHEEIELAQRVIHHFSEQLVQVQSIGTLSKEIEVLAKAVGARFSNQMESLFRESAQNNAQDVKQSPKNLDKAVLAMNQLQEMSEFNWSQVASTMDTFEKLENVMEQHRRAKSRQDQYVGAVQRIVESYDRKVGQEAHTAHTTIDILSLLLELEVQFLNQGKKLPIYDYRPTILEYIDSNRVTMIIAGTGSGKSTCVPQYLLNEMIMAEKATPTRRIAIAQPRRKATVSLAEFMSMFRESTLGDTVGFHIGKQRSMTRKNYTMIECMTFGILLGKSISDPSFSQYSVLFIDEVHENSPDLFMLFATIFLALKLNPELKIVLMSATIDPQSLVDYYGDIALCHVEVPTAFPIKVEYRNCSPENAIDKAIEEVVKIHQGNEIDEHPDILVFLPLVHNIVAACAKLTKAAKEMNLANLVSLPFYSMLADEEKKKVTDRSLCGKGLFRRVIFSTNIAETSLTLPELGFVIDSGLQLHVHKEVNTEIITRKQVRCSQSAAIQRRGRVGRTAPGTCICLYSESEFMFNFSSQQNVAYTDLAFPILGMIKNKIDVEGFPWYQRPKNEEIAEAFVLLEDLGLIVRDTNDADEFLLTKLGELAINLRGTGLTIRQVRFLFEAVKFGILQEAIVIFSFIITGMDPNKKAEEEEDVEDDLLDIDDDGSDDEEEENAEERFEHYKWYKNSDSSLETLLYHYNEWLKDKRYEPLKGQRMKRFKRAKKDIQSTLYRYDIAKKLKMGTFQSSQDPIGECLAVSYFSNIGYLTLSTMHPKTGEINSAMCLLNQDIGKVGIISKSQAEKYGFKNRLLMEHHGEIDAEESIHSASEYEPESERIPQGTTLGDFLFDSKGDDINELATQLENVHLSDNVVENDHKGIYGLIPEIPAKITTADLMKTLENALNGPVIDISKQAGNEPATVDLDTGIEPLDENNDILKWIESANAQNSDSSPKSKRLIKKAYSRKTGNAITLSQDEDDEKPEKYTMHKITKKSNKIRMIPERTPAPYYYFYISVHKHGETLFLSHLHRIRQSLSVPARWQNELNHFKATSNESIISAYTSDSDISFELDPVVNDFSKTFVSAQQNVRTPVKERNTGAQNNETSSCNAM